MLSLFKKTQHCSICGRKATTQISDGWLCKDCTEDSGLVARSRNMGRSPADWRREEVREILESDSRLALARAFDPTIRIGMLLWIDEVRELWASPIMMQESAKYPAVRPLADIAGYTLQVNDIVAVTERASARERAAAPDLSDPAAVSRLIAQILEGDRLGNFTVTISLADGGEAVIDFIPGFQIRRGSGSWNTTLKQADKVLFFLHTILEVKRATS